MNIIEALEDKRFFGPSFPDLGNWRAWAVYLRALFGLAIEGEDLELLKNCTGLEVAPATRSRESFVICGRRSGKSTIAALLAVYLATFRDWREVLKRGETGWIFILAVDKYQARIIKGYVRGMLEASPHFRQLIKKETQEAIQLSNGVAIEVKTSSYRSVRGYTMIAAILEEIAFWRSEESANPDRETVAAVRPALATIPESLLIGISTPYARSGFLWEQHRANFGKPGGPLIWKAPTRAMNPTIDSRLVENALRNDPSAARAEWEAEWRDDFEQLFTEELLLGVTVPGRLENPKIRSVDYYAFIDPSGGRQDSFTLGIAHYEKDSRIVLDVLRERRPPFSPKEVVAEFSNVLKDFKVSTVGADRYAGEWVTEAFRDHGIRIEPSEFTASEIYLGFLPLITSGSIELLESSRLVAQLTGLERRARAGGKDIITHYPGGHDDLANAAAGACFGAKRKGRSSKVRVRWLGAPEEMSEDENQRGWTRIY